MINVLQKAGQFKLAEAGIDYLLDHPFSGRPYPEADNPGEILWVMGEHWRLVRDAKWLNRVYPSVNKLAAMIEYYRTTLGPHWVQLDAIAFGDAIPQDRRQELKSGCCDGYHPEFTEAFDIAGLRAAADLAMGLSNRRDAIAYETLAKALLAKYDARFDKEMSRSYGSYSVLWPCRLYPFDSPQVVEQFGRIGPQFPKEDWRYFPLATAHQGLFAGSRLASVGTLADHLDHEQIRGWYAFDEGGPSNWGAWSQVRTNWDAKIAMPHGWATAELWLLMRDAILFEDGGRLRLFAGVPADWFVTPQGMKLERMPTWFGECSVEWTPTPTGADLKFTGAADPPEGVLLSLPTELAAKVVGEGAQLLSPVTGRMVSCLRSPSRSRSSSIDACSNPGFPDDP